MCSPVPVATLSCSCSELLGNWNFPYFQQAGKMTSLQIHAEFSSHVSLTGPQVAANAGHRLDQGPKKTLPYTWPSHAKTPPIFDPGGMFLDLRGRTEDGQDGIPDELDDHAVVVFDSDRRSAVLSRCRAVLGLQVGRLDIFFPWPVVLW